MVEAICTEIERRKAYLNGQIVNSIYFGGGTPSVLSRDQLKKLLQTIRQHFEINPLAEVTIETNPDDFLPETVESWKELGINRLSIGIQTFDDERLKFMNRSHNAADSLRALSLAQKFGFKNLTCDLIYAIPPNSMSAWKRDLNMLLDFEIPHISLYGLTVEEKTVFGKWEKEKRFQAVLEEENALQYEYAIQLLKAKGYQHYEVSNFCLPEMESQHNSSYWLQRHYLGVGPGAHSYNGHSRSYAVRSNQQYLSKLESGELPLETEQLSSLQKVNEHILTRIRTHYGIDLEYIQKVTGTSLIETHQTFISQSKKNGLMTQQGSLLTLTSQGMLNADEIALKLFFEE